MDILAFINLVAGLRGDLSRPTRKRMEPKIAALVILSTLAAYLNILANGGRLGWIHVAIAIAFPVIVAILMASVSGLFFWIGRGFHGAARLIKGSANAT